MNDTETNTNTTFLGRFYHYGYYGALLTAWVATLGSLYFSEVRHYVPCALCWYQRILMYPLAILLAAGLLRRDRHLAYLALPFSVIGQGMSTYHYLIQKTTIFGAPTACSAGVPCSTAYINWFGFVTIPFLAMMAFMMITVFCVVAIYRNELAAGEEESVPWPPVVAIVTAVVLFFVAISQPAETPVTQASENFIVETVAQSDQQTPVEPGDVDPALIAEGKALFEQACAACHGLEGEGVAGLGVSLTDSEVVLAHEGPDALDMIRSGSMPGTPGNTSGGVMPPSGGRPDLTDEQLLAIVAYLRTNPSGMQ